MVVAEQFTRRGEVPEDDAAVPGTDGPSGVLTGETDTQRGRGVLLHGPGAHRIEFEVGVVDDDVHPGEVAECEELRIAVRGLRRAASAEQDDLADVALPQRLQSVVGDVGARQFVDVHGEDPRDIEGDVAVADDDGAFAGQIEGAVGVVGVAVVPGDELGGGVAAGQVLARDPESAVGRRTGRIDHGVVMLEQFGVSDVASDLGGEVQGELLAPERPFERFRDRLGPRMIGGDTGAHETEGSREPVEHLDLDVGPFEQFLGGVAGRGAGADDGDPQRSAIARRRRNRHEGLPPLRRRVVLVPGRVDLGEPLLGGIELVVGQDRLDRARVGAGAAVDAGLRIDVQHLGGGELGLVRRGVDAVHGADRDAARVVAAGLGDHIGHGKSPRQPGGASAIFM